MNDITDERLRQGITGNNPPITYANFTKYDQTLIPAALGAGLTHAVAFKDGSRWTKIAAAGLSHNIEKMPRERHEFVIDLRDVQLVSIFLVPSLVAQS